ncbi:MAG: SGNH/GDSL hydrolase family protein [Desulfobacterales bacterium]|nr:SGNH/GDSL hydrolase family protein [Desulfobacterales bacterium]
MDTKKEIFIIEFGSKNTIERPSTCLFSIVLKKKVYEFFPVTSLYYFSILIMLCISSILLIDRILLPKAEVKSAIQVSGVWPQENLLINKNNNHKIRGIPIWHSLGITPTYKKKTSKRILVMGDSFVWGDGYANINDLWWRQLQWELQKRGYKDIEVVAAGLSGWSTRAQFMHLKEKIIPQFPIDIIIWGYVTNDPDEGVIPRLRDKKAWNKYETMLIDSDSFSTAVKKMSSPLPYLSKILGKFRKMKLMHDNPPPQTAGIPYADWELLILHGANFKKYSQTVKKLAKFQEYHGIPQFFVTLPNRPSYTKFNMQYEPVKKLFKMYEIPFYDILPEFIDAYGGDKRPVLYWGINPANGHPGSISTRFYAKCVVDILEKDYPEILPKKENIAFDLKVNDWLPWDLQISRKLDIVEFLWPQKHDLMPSMPFGYPYVQLNLEYPISISQINLKGSSLLKSTRIDLTFDSEYDITTYQLGEKRGNELLFELSETFCKRNVKTIRVSATFNQVQNIKTDSDKTAYRLILQCKRPKN